MTIEQLLKEQVASLEKLLEIKDKIIASLQPQLSVTVGTWVGHPNNNTLSPSTGAGVNIDQSRFYKS